jgi:hypothetical protein
MKPPELPCQAASSSASAAVDGDIELAEHADCSARPPMTDASADLLGTGSQAFATSPSVKLQLSSSSSESGMFTLMFDANAPVALNGAAIDGPQVIIHQS